MTHVTHENTGEGGNTKTPSRSRKWCMTINNYVDDDFSTFNDEKMEYIVGREVGTNDTKHLQCFVEFKNARTFASMKKNWPRAHIEKAKGNNKQNVEYCAKDGDFIITNGLRKLLPRPDRKARLLKKYVDVVWHDWQQNILDTLALVPDSRTVHWVTDKEGNKGKSFLAKYIVMKYNAIICSGKSNDINNQVNTWLESNPDSDPTVVILDIPRSSLGYINYTSLENLKNGMLYSGKYEGGICLFDHPHVIVFANEEPNCDEMSADRWSLKSI